MDILDKIYKLEKDADEFGFRWDNPLQILQQIKSECQEVAEQIDNNSNLEKKSILQEEISDLMHAVFSLCVFLGFDIKETINISIEKFAKRMFMVRKLALENGNDNLSGSSFSERMYYWDLAKEKLAVNTHLKDFDDLVIYPVLDIDKALKSFNQDRGLMHDIFKSMIEYEIPENLKMIDKARDGKDWNMIADIIHKIKGGAMYCGTTKLQYACLYYEKYMKSEKIEDLEEILEKVLDVCDETQAKIKSWLADKKEFFK